MTTDAHFYEATAHCSPAIGWCVASRVDPITGLVAFPDFHSQFPAVMNRVLASGIQIGLTIGDVDNLKEYVEGANAADPYCFGHLAGNALMSRLGAVVRKWFWQSAPSSGIVSTFGGDEIIVAFAVENVREFFAEIYRLQLALSASLPCTVSFAATVLSSQPIAGERADTLYLHAMTTLDRHLFRRKSLRRANVESGSFLLNVDLWANRAWDIE